MFINLIIRSNTLLTGQRLYLFIIIISSSSSYTDYTELLTYSSGKFPLNAIQETITK